MSAQDRLRTPGLLSLLGRNWWVLLLYGLVAVVFGLVAFVHPLAAAAGMAFAAGVLALAEGVVSLLALFDRGVTIPKGWLVLYALASIAFGVLAVANPAATAGALLLLLAAWLVVAGIYRIVFAIQVRKQIRGEGWIILSGILAIVLGVLFVLNPLSGVFVTTLWIGACALVYGVVQVFAAFRLRRFRPA